MLTIERFFSSLEADPLDETEWDNNRIALVVDDKGNEIFRMENIEAPQDWSQLAVDIAASKYFRKRGVPDTGHEISVRHLIYRVAHTITQSGIDQGYFDIENAKIFENELTWLLVNQHGAFNSPVWFNCGLYQEYGTTSDGDGAGKNWAWDEEYKQPVQINNNYERPQCSACFIQSVEDSLISMTTLQANEVQVFKYGSGTGTNFSKIRGKGEKLSGGGESSGVLSFLECFDRWAGSIKSGGTTRRAAKMISLDIDHPEINDFIDWKKREEEKARILATHGYGEGGINSEAYRTVSGQNGNNSIRIPDSFMEAYLNNEEWQTTLRTTGEAHQKFEAKKLMRLIAEAAWQTGDPALQFDDHINAMHTCPETDRIFASNPCSEFMFLDDSACNLASINLTKYILDDNSFDLESFSHTVRIFFIAQEILIDFCSYPSREICQNSHDYRPVGLGYTNLGAFLMRCGIPYDSPEARQEAAHKTSIMSVIAYKISAEIAELKGPFEKFLENKEAMLEVMNKHRETAKDINQEDWDEVIRLGKSFGYRNAQVTLLAPTGTISLMMDCDTTGIEPDFALVKIKKYAGGGSVKIVNQSAEIAMSKLGYSESEIRDVMKYMLGTSSLDDAPYINKYALQGLGLNEEHITKAEEALPSALSLSQVFNLKTLGKEAMSELDIDEEVYNQHRFNLLAKLGFAPEQIQKAGQIICGTMTLEGSPHIKDEHLPIFDCANRCGATGQRFIEPMAHVQMLAAVEPLLSGSVSKTINLPNDATIEDIEKIYTESWRLGLKGVCLYRDGSKQAQPLTSRDGQNALQAVTPVRRRLPDERESIAHKFSVGGYEGYLHVGFYQDGTPGELFIRMAKEGSIISGLMDTIATLVSIVLQYGVPLDALVRKFVGMHFEPLGVTTNKEIPKARSIVDYIFRWIGLKFLDKPELVHPEQPALIKDNDNENNVEEKKPETTTDTQSQNTSQILYEEERICFNCGWIGYGTGHCFRCLNCGTDNGCFF